LSSKINKEYPISIPEILKILSSIDEDRLTPIQQRVLDYASKFSKVDPDNASKLFSILTSDFEVEPELAVQLVDIMPQSVEEIRSILRTGRWRLVSTEVFAKILEVLDSFRSSR
jgi:DNA-directed RNA polymerase subunit F